MSQPPRPNLDQVFAERLQAMATTLQPGTMVTYRAALNRFLRYLDTSHPEVRQLSQLRRDPHILGWLRNLCEQDPPLANDTRGNYLVALRRVFHDLASRAPVPPSARTPGAGRYPTRGSIPSQTPVPGGRSTVAGSAPKNR